MNEQLEELARRQGTWTATASSLKSRYQNVRWMTFGLSIAGALLASVAGQLDGPLRLYLAITSAVLFGLASFMAQRFLDAAHAQAWVRARAASEGLKRLAYTYAAKAGAFSDPKTRDEAIRKGRQELEDQVDDLLGIQVDGSAGSTPKGDLDPAGYVDKRVRDQVAFYGSNADRYKKTADRLRRAEFLLALVTGIITAVAGVLNKDTPRGGAFDFVALTAVLTTISGMIVAHIEASRFDFLVTTYRATKRRLSDALSTDPARLDQSSPEWSAFVEGCEGAIAAENGSWVLKMVHTA